ncbi:MAG: coenzyme F420 hydrogenase [Promethearchaeota archaeon]|nr:MAG: coenzyme F420 hydrogenase [Candidatus Lokiarchaeota archaeon]
MADMAITKTFEDLIKEVHEPGLCGECGGCVSFCSAGELKAIEMSESGPPKFINKDKCLKCGICYFVCPQTHVLNDQLNKKFKYEAPIGNHIKVASCHATSEELRKQATDGGAVTAILSYLLDNKLIDGAVVCKRKGPFNRVPFFATTKEDLIEAAGSHYDVSSQVVGLEKYNTFIAANITLKKVMNPDLLNIAVVGTPCQINSIRKMQELSILPAHIVKYTLGLFCYLNFSFNDEDRKMLEEKFKFSFEDVDSMNIREDLILYFKNDEVLHIPFSDIYEIGRPACFACPDFSNIYSDISFGGLGSEEKLTTAIIRTKIGEELYRNAINKGYIKEPTELNKPNKKDEMLVKIKEFSKKKIERAETTLKGKKT